MESLVVLVESLRYGGKDLKRGDVFEAPTKDARALRAARRAVLDAEKAAAPVVESAAAPVEADPQVAESVDSTEAVAEPEVVGSESQEESESAEVTEAAPAQKRRGRPSKASQ